MRWYREEIFPRGGSRSDYIDFFPHFVTTVSPFVHRSSTVGYTRDLGEIALEDEWQEEAG